MRIPSKPCLISASFREFFVRLFFAFFVLFRGYFDLFLCFLCLPPPPSLWRDKFSRLFLALHQRESAVEVFSSRLFAVPIRVYSRFLFAFILGRHFW